MPDKPNKLYKTTTIERSLSINEVADACSLSRNTVRRMIEDGRLPAVRIGHQWRIRPEHVRNILGVPA
jgi:excisionase family DNA binding protein